MGPLISSSSIASWNATVLRAGRSIVTWTGLVSDLVEYHSQREDALLQVDEAVVVGPVFLQGRLDVGEVVGQRLLVDLLNLSQRRDLYTSTESQQTREFTSEETGLD